MSAELDKNIINRVLRQPTTNCVHLLASLKLDRCIDLHLPSVGIDEGGKQCCNVQLLILLQMDLFNLGFIEGDLSAAGIAELDELGVVSGDGPDGLNRQPMVHHCHSGKLSYASGLEKSNGRRDGLGMHGRHRRINHPWVDFEGELQKCSCCPLGVHGLVMFTAMIQPLIFLTTGLRNWNAPDSRQKLAWYMDNNR